MKLDPIKARLGSIGPVAKNRMSGAVRRLIDRDMPKLIEGFEFLVANIERYKVGIDVAPLSHDAQVVLDSLEMVMCEHKMVSHRAGGHPADASSAEMVTYCELCGMEPTE